MTTDPENPEPDYGDFETDEQYNAAWEEHDRHAAGNPFPGIFYLLEGAQIGYLPGEVGQDGWRRGR